MSNAPEVVIVGGYYDVPMKRMMDEIPCVRLADTDDPEAALAAAAPTAKAIAAGGGVSAEMMDKLPNLGIIANFGVGYDNIDIEAATARGIKVTNTPDVLSDEVADLAIALMLAASRRMIKADRYARSGDWEKHGKMAFTQKVTGKRLGILGLGRIGLEVARRAEGFKMDIAYHTRTPKDCSYKYYENLQDMAENSDIMIAIVPGGAATHHIVSEQILEALGPTGIFVNVARGSVVDEDAMIRVLKDGRLGAAGLDVFDQEPKIPSELKEMQDNVVLQPHHASATHDTRDAMGQMVTDNIQAFLSGKPLITPVN